MKKCARPCLLILLFGDIGLQMHLFFCGSYLPKVTLLVLAELLRLREGPHEQIFELRPAKKQNKTCLAKIITWIATITLADSIGNHATINVACRLQPCLSHPERRKRYGTVPT